ncbi:unnamed protein product [Paramecium pentaurelia]|uniref:Transmembrane protein n=1 Tax=Paramecium pentaurelia TaxID=43138 RepID=A0A8S1XMX3_9CILI|nr:unnamed protein product [Paramecium pentaurelia]
MNLTNQQAQENANFALELWVNTENFLNKTQKQMKNQSILNIINNQQFQEIIPQDQKGLQATQQYIEQWQNQTDDDKSIILQYVVVNINQMIQSEDPTKYNQTNLIEHISNQTFILDQNQKNKNTTQYISPLTWQHANVSNEEMILAKFFYNTKNQNLTFQEEFDKLSVQEAASLLNAFEKFFIDSNKNTNTNSTTNNINSKGEQPIEQPEQLPQIKSNNNSDNPIYMILVFSLIFIILIGILFILRRYLIQQKLATFQMNEEINPQGLQA